MTPDDELMALLRGLVQRGVVHRVDDTGGVQQADVETAEGVVRSGVHVVQMPGLACNPGTDGVMAVVISPGGDQGLPLVILAATGAGLGNLAAGEMAIYALDGGARIHCQPGGTVHAMAATKIIAEAPEIDVTATTKASVTAPEIDLVGTVKISGTLQVNGITVTVP